MLSIFHYAARAARRLLAGPCAFIALACAHAAEQPEPQIVMITARAGGAEWQLHTQIFKPNGAGPFPVLIFSHGRATDRTQLANLPYPVLRGHAAYWMRKGFAVVAPVRPGYGATGGADLENSGIRISTSGLCGGTPNFGKAMKNAADIVSDVVAWTRLQTWADRDHIILAGQSVGGLTSVAAGARALPGVVAYINFSGGQGGNPQQRPGASCFPDALAAIFAEYGQTTRLPNLWLYASNDQYWGPDQPKLWHEAFRRAGGAGRFVQTAPLPGEDGHRLLAKGGRLWADHVNPFVESLGFKPSAVFQTKR